MNDEEQLLRERSVWRAYTAEKDAEIERLRALLSGENPMESITKEEMVDILSEIAEAIETNRSESLRHMAWRMEQEIREEQPDLAATEEEKP